MAGDNLYYRASRWIAVSAAVISALLMHGCVLWTSSGTTAILERKTLPAGEIEHPFDLFTEYRIAPGDVLDVLFQIQTWKETKEFRFTIDQELSVKFVNNPELNEVQTIRPDGTISLPYIGNIHVTGKTVEELTLELKKLYRKVLREKNKKTFKLAVNQELTVNFLNNPALNVVQTIRPDGTISLPYIGKVQVTGKTSEELTLELKKRYRKIIQAEKKVAFKLAANQELSVKFLNNPELNEVQRIRPDGTISLPYINNIHVAGKTVGELAAELKKRYRNILQIPELHIIISDIPFSMIRSEPELHVIVSEFYSVIKELEPELHVVVSEFRSAIKELKHDLHTAPRGLSRLVTVRPDGFVTFPMIGDVFVAGKSIPDVNETLNLLYNKIIDGLHCDLFLEKHSGSLIYLIGQVKKPGAYKILRPMSVLQSLALAGGSTVDANLDSVIVARKHNKKVIVHRIDLEKPLSMTKDSHLTYLQPGDIVYVPRTWISELAQVSRYIKDITYFRGWGTNINFSWELKDVNESNR